MIQAATAFRVAPPVSRQSASKTDPRTELIGPPLRGDRRGLLLGRQKAERINGRRSTSGNNRYRIRSEIFDPHSDGPLHRPKS